MELDFNSLMSLAMKFWQWTTLIILIIVGFIINCFDLKSQKERISFKFKEFPHMKPISIATKGKGFWSAIVMWLLGVRQWEIVKDFNYSIGNQKYKIPAGFKFDGASVPKFLASFLSPTGVLLLGGLVHDYGYKYQTLLLDSDLEKKGTCGVKSQKWMDQLFRDINIEINGFYFLNYLAYYGLRLGGWLAWRKHRKVNAKIEGVK
jgi:hypothetical protein